MPRMQRGLPQKRRIPGVKKVVVVSSGKGGVGKSSVSGTCDCSVSIEQTQEHNSFRLLACVVACLPTKTTRADNLHDSVNLALALSQLPQDVAGGRPRVGLLDLDIFGPSIPKLMGLEGAGEPLLSKGALVTLCRRSALTYGLLATDNRLTPLRAHGLPCMSMGFLLPNAPNTDGSNNADTPVVWRGMMVMKAVQQLLFEVDWRAGAGGHDLDLLVVDMPPGTGDVTLSLGQLVIVDGKLSCRHILSQAGLSVAVQGL